MPRQLRRDLPEFAIRTVQEEGWSSVQNGELLRLASESFDVMVTADERLQFQQNIASFDLDHCCGRHSLAEPADAAPAIARCHRERRAWVVFIVTAVLRFTPR
jgi:hypothetical protein